MFLHFFKMNENEVVLASIKLKCLEFAPLKVSCSIPLMSISMG